MRPAVRHTECDESDSAAQGTQTHTVLVSRLGPLSSSGTGVLPEIPPLPLLHPLSVAWETSQGRTPLRLPTFFPAGHSLGPKGQFSLAHLDLLLGLHLDLGIQEGGGACQAPGSTSDPLGRATDPWLWRNSSDMAQGLLSDPRAPWA